MWTALRATDNRTANCTLILPRGVERQFCWARTAHQRQVRRRSLRANSSSIRSLGRLAAQIC